MKIAIPYALVAARLAIAICFVPAAMLRKPPVVFAVLLIIGLLTDFFDGFLAARMRVLTPALRRADSRVDIVFFLSAGIAPMILYPDLLCQWLPWIAGYACLFVLRNVVDFVRYRSSPSYHMWSGRLWANLMIVFLILAYFGINASILGAFCFLLYTFNAAEGIIASLVLSKPLTDIPTLWHVFKIKESSPHDAAPDTVRDSA